MSNFYKELFDKYKGKNGYMNLKQFSIAVNNVEKEIYPLPTIDINNSWECANSPDGDCHYYTDEHNVIKLNDGTTYNMGSDHDRENESDDCCLFCGEPEERK